MFDIDDVYYVASLLNIKFDKFSPEELMDGMNIELEHGLVSPKTNVTDDDIVMTTKVALAHLNEFPNYYNKNYGLRNFEEFLKTKL